MTTKEQVMQTLIEAGFSGSVAKMWIGHFEKFAQLVRDNYRAELLKGVGEPARKKMYYCNKCGTFGDGVEAHKEGCGYQATSDDGPYYSPDQLAAAVLAAGQEQARLGIDDGLRMALAAIEIYGLKDDVIYKEIEKLRPVNNLKEPV